MAETRSRQATATGVSAPARGTRRVAVLRTSEPELAGRSLRRTPFDDRAGPNRWSRGRTPAPTEQQRHVELRHWRRPEQHTSELQSLMPTSSDVFSLKKQSDVKD